MANEYQITQLLGEAYVALVQPPATARISLVKGEAFVQHVKSFPEGGHRYWRFRFVSTTGSNNRLTISEIGVFSGGQSVIYPCRWAANVGVNLEPQSFDGSTSTGYDSGNSALPVIISMDFVDAGTIRMDNYSFQMFGSTVNAPTEWYLEYSDDNSLWEEADHQVGITWAATQLRTFAVAGGGGSSARRRNFMSFNP